MAYTLFGSSLLRPTFGDPEIEAIFSDPHFLAQMLEVELALAEVQAALGVIPADAAGQIKSKLDQFEIDIPKLQIGIDKAGIPVPAFVSQLRDTVGGDAATYIHWGATSQDILDTAFVLQAGAALKTLKSKLVGVINQFKGLADHHRYSVMVGHTHSQQALPITFGLKVANWIAPLIRHLNRLDQLEERLLVVQFGGAAGTLASLGQMGLAVQRGLAKRLKLEVPNSVWHTQRDSFAELAGWLSLISGSLAKMGQDIILMAQNEVGELRESADKSRGGSSTMPQKANPIQSEMIIAAARANASLISAMHQAQIAEHERATHGWQLEWATLPQMFVYTATALNKALFLANNLVVNVERMSQNVAASNGLMLAEAASLALAEKMGRSEAKGLVKEACLAAVDSNRHMFDILAERSSHQLDWESLRNERNYLGETDRLIDQILNKI